MNVALIQVASPATESVADRRRRVGELVASVTGADLIVLPELWAVGYFSFDRYAAAAEPLDGPTVAEAAAWARATRSYVHAGSFIERAGDGRVHNTAVLLDPGGTVVHVYRKAHVFGYDSREAELLAPGSEVSVAPTPFGAIGATTCYDLRFPELWRALLDAGGEIGLTPAAWPAARLSHWRLLTSARAVENLMLVIACNAVGVQAGVALGGHSRIVDPWGTALAEAGDEEGITRVDLDPGVVQSYRREFPVLDDRRAWDSPRRDRGTRLGLDDVTPRPAMLDVR